MRARSIVFTLLLVAVAGCTGRSDLHDRGGVTSPTHPDVLVVGTPNGSVLIGSSSGSVLSPGEDQVAAPDGSRLYRTTSTQGTTVLEARDASTGDALSRATLGGRLEVRVASLRGSAVALMRPLPVGVETTLALPRAHTTIVTVDPDSGAARRYRLKGNFEPEAFSVDDTRLFLIQYLPALAPSVYRVTFLDLADGTVHPVFGRFKTPPARMPGVRLAQVFDPTAEQLYTLYTNRTADHSYEQWPSASYGDREVSFVHVLNLRKGWAYCAGLPRTLWGHPATVQAMAPSPDGRSLYIVDSMRGIVAEMNTRSLEITRTARIDLGPREEGRTWSLMSVDGHTLYVGVGGATVSRIDVDPLEVLGRWRFPAPVTGLASSEDGTRLYAALGDRIAIVDPGTGSSLGSISFGRVESILHVTSL